MSMEVHVFVEGTSLPAIEQWQTMLRSTGFDMTFSSILPIVQHKGFLPVLFNGNKTGFELDVFPAEAIIEAYEQITEIVQKRDLSVNFRWGGDLQECSAAIAAAAVLTLMTDGMFYDPQEDKIFTKDDVIPMARQTLKEIEAL
jgi:hypothetical protein